MPRRRSATSKEVADIIVSTAALEERVGNLIDEFQRERDGAAQHRRDLREVIGALSGSVQELTRQMLEAKPLWKDYEERRAEARGAAKLVKALYALFAAGFGAGGAMLVEFFRPR